MQDTPAKLVLDDGVARAVILPRLGAGLACYDLLDSGFSQPLFRPSPTRADPHPFDLAFNVLVPWSNRISNGGFDWRGVFRPLYPNLPGEVFPIHGSGFSSAWRVSRHDATSAVLCLDKAGPPPFLYNATLRYSLEAGSLLVELSIINIAEESLPYGAGFHPWFPRTPETALQFSASGIWLEDEKCLPTYHVSISERPDWNFRRMQPLPGGWINNAFTGCSGPVVLAWPDRGLGMEIVAGPELSILIVHSPSANADFCCVEPVSHSVDSHNRSINLGDRDLSILAPLEELKVDCKFNPVQQLDS